MADTNNNSIGHTNSSTTTVVSTQVPGVDMALVIASQPYMVKENSSRIETREIKLDRG